MQVVRVFPCLVMAALLVGCDGQPLEPVPDEALTPAFKVDRQEYSYLYDLDWDPPYEDCVTGEPMQNHGFLRVHVRETTTPSGNVTVHGWVDYGAFGPVTLEGLWSGVIWTLTNGHNPYGEVIKENGSYLLHYHWNESYSNPDGEKLKIHLKGHMKIDKDGNMTINRHSYRCF